MKSTTAEAFKKVFNKKIVLGMLAIILAMVFIGITSFVPFAISKERLQSESFWTDELIIVAITIFAMISTMFVGQAGNAQNPNSELARAKVNFKASLAQIDNTNFFFQWVKKVLQPRDIQCIKERELRKIGIDDYSILNLNGDQIALLETNPQKFEDRYYNKLTKEQVKTILYLKDGVKNLNLVEPGYYLTVSSIETDKTDSEKSGKEQLVKILRLIFSVVGKIILTLIPAIIFAALVRDLTVGEGGDAAAAKAQAWATFCSRMFSLVSSAFMGYIVGCQMNDIDADYIELKIRVHKSYCEDKTFKPLSQQEMAREEFDRVNKE